MSTGIIEESEGVSSRKHSRKIHAVKTIGSDVVMAFGLTTKGRYRTLVVPNERSPFSESRASGSMRALYTEKELPHPQLPVEFGLLKVNPEPMTELT